MNDFDLLVPQNDALKAVDLLCQSGLDSRLIQCLMNRTCSISHASHLIDDSGIEFDLHWRIMPESGLQ
ncbi:MAG: nucleotidyltransferase family protein [Desulfobacterales bacterium]|nr:nucleotidyltransferase family protein [Desulfobacterales bacterium]